MIIAVNFPIHTFVAKLSDRCFCFFFPDAMLVHQHGVSIKNLSAYLALEKLL